MSEALKFPLFMRMTTGFIRQSRIRIRIYDQVVPVTESFIWRNPIGSEPGQPGIQYRTLECALRDRPDRKA